MPEKKICSMPNPLTLEWLAGFNRKSMSYNIWQGVDVSFFKETDNYVLNSREMEIALTSHIYIDKEYNLELDKFFMKNYPNVFKNAMKLAFKHYLDYRAIYKREEEHPHFQTILNLIKEMPEYSDFYEICHSLKEEFNNKIKIVNETWGKIKGVHFEKAIMAVNILYLRTFLPHFNDILEQNGDILKYKEFFLKAAGDYLIKTNEHWKSIDKNLWKDLYKLVEKMGFYFASLLNKDKELLGKINDHIMKKIDLQAFRYGKCESFIFDKTFKEEPYSFDKQDDDICNLKNLVLPIYYKGRNYKSIVSYIEQSRKANPDFAEVSHHTNALSFYVHVHLLKEYFGLEEQFSYNDKAYSLPELIGAKNSLSGCYQHIHLKELQDFFQNFHGMSFENMLATFCMGTLVTIGKNRLPVDIRYFSELANTSNSDKDNFKLLSTDISDNELQVNLCLYNTFYCEQSDVCIVFPYIRATNEAGYLDLLNLIRRKNNKNSKEDAKRIENTVAQQFKDFPVFSDAKITTNEEFENGEIDVAIYKDNILILIEVKSTYGIINFEERFVFEKHLIYAGHQLNKAINALKTDAKLLAKITGDSSVKFSQLRLETLIVGTSFEFDNKRFSGHRKISLLELMVCLHNDALYLIDIDEVCKGLTNNAERMIDETEDFEIEKKIGEELSFYNKNPTIDDFFKALNSNIWEKILPYYQKKL